TLLCILAVSREPSASGKSTSLERNRFCHRISAATRFLESRFLCRGPYTYRKRSGRRHSQLQALPFRRRFRPWFSRPRKSQSHSRTAAIRHQRAPGEEGGKEGSVRPSSLRP